MVLWESPQPLSVVQVKLLLGVSSTAGGTVALIGQSGGTLEAGREAGELIIESGRVAGVGHHARDGGDRRVDRAPLVFGNAAPDVLAAMLPEHEGAAFLAPYANRRPSISLWTVSLGVSRPAKEFGVRSYSTFILPDWMRAFAEFNQAADVMAGPPGGRMPPYVLVDYRQIDSGLNEAGPFLLTLCGADRFENWSLLDAETRKTREQSWIVALTGEIDRHFPGLASAVVHREMATADTMQHYLIDPALIGLN